MAMPERRFGTATSLRGAAVGLALVAAAVLAACPGIPGGLGPPAVSDVPGGAAMSLEAGPSSAGSGSRVTGERTRVAIVTIRWPDRRRTQAIPDQTAAFRLLVFGGPGLGLIDQAQVDRPPDATTSTVVLPTDPEKELPVGAARFEAYALDAGGSTLASASAEAEVLSNRAVDVRLQFPAVEPPAPTPTPTTVPSPTETPTPTPTPTQASAETPTPTPTPTPSPTPTPTPSPTPTPTPAPPVLTSVAPGNGGSGAGVALRGSGFGTGDDALAVYFGEVQATTVVRSDTGSISTGVPAGATTGLVTVSVDGRVSNSLPFMVLGTLTLEPAAIVVRAGTTFDPELTAKDTAGDPVSSPAVTWTLSGSSAKADPATGRITGLEPGDGTLRVSSGNLAATASVHVFAISGVSLDKTALTLNAMPIAGDPDPDFAVAGRIIATVAASDGTSRKVVWTSVDETRVTVDRDGWVRTVRNAPAGSAVVTATAQDDSRSSASATVTVTRKGRLEIGVY